MEIPDREFSLAEVRRGTGERGTRKLVAYDGLVYDVTDCRRWSRDMHEQMHFPGQDLSGEMDGAPHKADVFNRPCVKLLGRLVE